MTAELVVISLERWDEVWRRNQYLVDGLLRRDPALRVLFVEPVHDLLYSLVTGDGLGRGEGLRRADGYEGRLWLLQPTKLLPRVLGGIADALLRRSVLRAATRAGLAAPTLWINDPGWARLLQARPAWPAIYDITDDWTLAERAPRERERIVRNETLLLDRADAVVVCSNALAASKGKDRAVVHVSNGVDVERYRVPASRPPDLPPGRNAVYLGTLHEDRLDVALTARVAREVARSGAHLVLVGPNLLPAARTEELTGAGAVILGPRPFAEVPGYLQHAAALVVPHVVSAFTDSLDPIKLYEYLAVGRPIVSTPVAGFRDVDLPGVHTAGADELPGVLIGLLAQNPPSIIHTAIPDWTTQVDSIAGVLDAIRR